MVIVIIDDASPFDVVVSEITAADMAQYNSIPSNCLQIFPCILCYF